MIDPFTTNTTASSVSAARNDLTSTISISGRPQVTYIFPIRFADVVPSGNPMAQLGYTRKFTIHGYGLERVTSVYLSGVENAYGVPTGSGPGTTQTNYLSTITAFDSFGSLSGLSAHYPSFSAHKLTGDLYGLENDNTMTVTVCATQNTGDLNIIIENPAGYCTLSTDLSTRLINVIN